MYFYTDVFKTDKEKFFKYIAKNVEVYDSFKSEELTQYLNKKKTQAYENEGEFYAQIDEQTAKEYMPNKKIYNEVKNFKIVFDGKKDIPNNYEHDTVSLQYSNGEKMTFEYMNDQDYYGIKVDKILKKFLAIENNNLKEFAKNLGITDTSNIPDKIEVKDYSKYKFTKEEEKTIYEKLYKVLEDNLQENMFREEKTESYSKHSLTTTYKKLVEVYFKICQELINDETVLKKLKTISIEVEGKTEQEVDEQIAEIKESFNKEMNDFWNEEGEVSDSDTTNSKANELVTISVYETKGKITNTEIIAEEGRVSLGFTENKLTFKIDESSKDGEATVYNPLASVVLEKSTINDGLNYNLNISADAPTSSNIVCEMNFNFKGINNSDNALEDYLIDLKTNNDNLNSEFKYVLKNNVTFKDNIEKEDLKSNSIKLNDYNYEKMMSTLQRLTSSIDNLNKKQMQSLGLEANQNPVNYLSPIFSYTNGALSIVNDAREATNTANLSEQEAQAFNMRFKAYEGQNISGSRVNALIQQVLYTNSNLKNDSSSKIKEVLLTFDGKEYNSENIGNIRAEVDKTYTVKLNYIDGYVNRIDVITD